MHIHNFRKLFLITQALVRVYSLQSLIMIFLMNHEQYDGFHSRRWYSHVFEFSLLPRSRNVSFYPVLLGLILRESKERAQLFNRLYYKGLTTEQIDEISDAVCERTYSKQLLLAKINKFLKKIIIPF